ncbi:DUF1801 domain-containing protein [Paracoccus suum]|uniref:DUF1801 domain-containing protein n=1 Tax=Paracoccus suum TaxID=2259340 RepID=A0A344PJ13_9RHOB|nr:DUF1801 domain-containing protein [Paracoccus suum]AXC49368.1 DUF1801 domain-containing protein [Paracoccus suum]
MTADKDPDKKTPTKKKAISSDAKSEDGKAKNGPRLLAGGNPQIPKADGDAPVQDWIAAAPGWKSDVARRIDKLIVKTVPDVRKAVKWNQPFYGAPNDPGWFLGMHCLTRYLKIAFFNGTSLDPLPPAESKKATIRYLHVFEDKPLDEDQFVEWVCQAAKRPGMKL